MTKREEIVLNKFKYYFRMFFEGLEYLDEKFVDPIVPMSIFSFGITNIECWYFDGIYHIKIILERPGILIGPKGNIINSLTEFIHQQINPNIKIIISESQLWTINYNLMNKELM
ncbi:MAG TPA: hypothetical protein PLI22_02210 [Caldisericia bacterium]|mgnify:CR=1 FL=1|nr:hypothetical protein [Caldisericia bacterium]